jgi:D-3-phosphoglycerate dehydrogenase
MINAERLRNMKTGVVLLNFAREGIIDDSAVCAALDSGKVYAYVCDFPANLIKNHPRIITLPHIGASTREAEENCAVMVADQVRDYLEHGNIHNAVNFPEVMMPRTEGQRLAVANANVPNMLGQISTALAQAGLNILDMLNKSRGDLAYTLVDVEGEIPATVVDKIAAIEGVLSVRIV